MTRKKTLEQVQIELDAVWGAGLITISPGQTYLGTRMPLRFVDRDFGEWEASAFTVLVSRNSHPERSKLRRANTNIEKYGHENPFGSAEVKEKIKRLNLTEWGVEYPAQHESVKKKIRATNVEKYGCEAPISQNAEVVSKAKAKIMERFGVENVAHSEKVKAQKITTLQTRYGVSAPSHIHAHKLPNGMRLKEYMDAHKCTLHQTSLWNVYSKFGFEAVRDYVENGKTFHSGSSLEDEASKLLGIPSFGKNLGTPRRSPDFQLDATTFLDVDGLYFHSQLMKKDNYYHFNKRLQYEEVGYRLLQLRSDEIETKPLIVGSVVANIQGNSVRHFARKCEIRTVSWREASAFFDANHLQGAGAPAACFGLFENGVLFNLMGVRKKDGATYEISRFCSLLNHTVIGGFTKLLKHAVKTVEATTIISWCDLRYGTGGSYEAAGFKRVKETLGWQWTNFWNTFNRRKCRANMDERKLTQTQQADEFGWVKIYDAGQRLYLKEF